MQIVPDSDLDPVLVMSTVQILLSDKYNSLAITNAYLINRPVWVIFHSSSSQDAYVYAHDTFTLSDGITLISQYNTAICHIIQRLRTSLDVCSCYIFAVMYLCKQSDLANRSEFRLL